MATATDSTTAPVVPFPIDRARKPGPDPTRKPDPLGRHIDGWTRARIATQAVSVFGKTEAEAFEFARALIFEGGPNPIAHVLDETAYAIRLLRGALDELVAADRLIVSAVERALVEGGAHA